MVYIPTQVTPGVNLRRGMYMDENLNSVVAEVETPVVPAALERRVTMNDFMEESKPITMDSFYPEGETRKRILPAKPRTKQYTPNPGSEGYTMHQAILRLHTENKPITVGAIYALCGQLLGKGKPRIQQHVQGMLRIGVLVRVSTGAYSLVEGK